tara:strand:+ start:4430 stop:4624 length:195 start_codon:yes stop_codon:yes gene_type:complete
MKKAIAIITAATALLVSSCSFNGKPAVAGASAVIGQRNVLGAEVNVFNWRRVGAGIWIQQPKAK